MFVLLFISICSPLIPLIAGLKNRRTLLWLYVLTGFIFDLTITYLKRGLKVNYDWTSNLFVLVEFFFLSFYYKNKIFKNSATLFYGVLIAVGSTFIVHTLMRANSIWSFNTYGSCVFFFTYIVYGIVGMYTLLKEQEVFFLERSPFFWVNVAFILYSSGNFLLFLFKIYLQETDKELLQLLWKVFFLPLNILTNVSLGIGLSKNVKS